MQCDGAEDAADEQKNDSFHGLIGLPQRWTARCADGSADFCWRNCRGSYWLGSCLLKPLLSLAHPAVSVVALRWSSLARVAGWRSTTPATPKQRPSHLS